MLPPRAFRIDYTRGRLVEEPSKKTPAEETPEEKVKSTTEKYPPMSGTSIPAVADIGKLSVSSSRGRGILYRLL